VCLCACLLYFFGDKHGIGYCLPFIQDSGQSTAYHSTDIPVLNPWEDISLFTLQESTVVNVLQELSRLQQKTPHPVSTAVAFYDAATITAFISSAPGNYFSAKCGIVTLRKLRI
jgi:hypothetical protein